MAKAASAHHPHLIHFTRKAYKRVTVTQSRSLRCINFPKIKGQGSVSLPTQPSVPTIISYNDHKQQNLLQPPTVVSGMVGLDRAQSHRPVD